MNIQHWVHWLDEGFGGRILAGVAAGLCTILFSVFVGYKQYQGPGEEQVFRDALLGKNMVQGKGYTLPVNYPHVVAYLEEQQAISFDRESEIFDLYRAPLYPAWLALGLGVLPNNSQQRLFSEPSLSGNYAGDIFLLAMNLILFWVVCLLTWGLGFRLFGKTAAWLALAGVLFSYGVWQQILAVNGVGVLMLGVLSLMHLLINLENAMAQQALRRKLWVWCIAVGLNGAALFLTDYSAALIMLPVVGWILIRGAERERWMVVLSVLTVFLVVVAPWCLRNYALTNSPVGLAWSDFFLRAGDPSAEPSAIKNSWETTLPAASVRKIIGKGLDGIRLTFSEKLWSGGAMLFVAFAICSLFYRYKNTTTNAVRWIMVISALFQMLLYPFISSGESMRQPVYYSVPLIVVLGAGFIVLLWESSSGKRPAWMKYLVFFIIILVQALPLARPLLQPATHVYFRHPVYLPRIMYLLGPGVGDKLAASQGMMSDVPAGLAWYSGQRIWAQPQRYLDFAMVMNTQTIGALYLSPNVLDRPYFSELAAGGERATRSVTSLSPTWSRVYAGIQQDNLPLFFPLQNSVRIMDNAILFSDN